MLQGTVCRKVLRRALASLFLSLNSAGTWIAVGGRLEGGLRGDAGMQSIREEDGLGCVSRALEGGGRVRGSSWGEHQIENE